MSGNGENDLKEDRILSKVIGVIKLTKCYGAIRYRKEAASKVSKLQNLKPYIVMVKMKNLPQIP